VDVSDDDSAIRVFTGHDALATPSRPGPQLAEYLVSFCPTSGPPRECTKLDPLLQRTENPAITLCLAAHLHWGVYLGRLSGLYLTDAFTSQGDFAGWWGEEGMTATPEAAANGREVLRALHNQPSHTSGCGDGKNLRCITAHPIIVERAGTNKAGYQIARCTHESDPCFVG
jgi:hypothetical protein